MDDPGLTGSIFVGIQTSSDAIYHLTRLGPGRYLCTPKGADAPPPYAITGQGAQLLSRDRMETEYPRAWSYLQSWAVELRRREGGAFDDEQWYRFGRHQNLDKQEIEKLIVAQTVPSLRVCADPSAALYLNNVRVNGIVPATGTNPWFLLGVLNAPVGDHVFRMAAKPKDGGWFEANRQFIEYLPIPDVTPRFGACDPAVAVAGPTNCGYP